MRLALRALLHSPGYTAIAVLTLALGIGVHTSMFSVLAALLFRSTPFPESERLVQLAAQTRSGERSVYSAVEIEEIRRNAGAFAALTTLGQTFFSLAEPGQPAERIGGTLVSEDFPETFRAAPILGRLFTPEEYLPGRNQVVVLSHAYWQQRYAGAPDVLGRTLRLDGENVTIVGVMPAWFDYAQLWRGSAFWRPLNYTRDQQEWRDYRAFTLLGRLQSDATLAQVAAELAPIATEQEQRHPESYAGVRYRALPLHEALMDDLGRKISWMLLGLAGFVLLIACANLANLQLARATAHVREIAIRAALGASRWRLMRQQIQESILLAVGGGGLGVLLAFAINRIVEREFRVGGIGGVVRIELDGGVLALTLVVSLLTGILFGLAPAWLASRADVHSVLKLQTRGGSAGRGQHRVRQALIVAEVALALVLLGGAAMLQRGFARTLTRETGWDTKQVLTAGLPVSERRISGNEERVALYRRLELRLQELPGVDEAAIATSLPVVSYTGDRRILIDGQNAGDPALPTAFHVMITSRYFAALGIPLLEGRLFAEEVRGNDPPVIIINEALARRLWPGQSALGRRIGSMDSGQPYWAEVIGVVRDVDTAASTHDPATPFQIYKPLAQEAWSYVQLVLRSSRLAGVPEAVRRAVAEVDPDLALAFVATVEQTVERQQHNLVLAARTLTGFAILGLILAALGLYGVISHLVVQRTGEFGIRLALGAQPGDVLQLVLRHGLMLTLVGTVLGLAGAYALGRLLASLLPRIAAPELLTLGGVATLLFLTALLACWFPARRATLADPLSALRAE